MQFLTGNYNGGYIDFDLSLQKKKNTIIEIHMITTNIH